MVTKINKIQHYCPWYGQENSSIRCKQFYVDHTFISLPFKYRYQGFRIYSNNEIKYQPVYWSKPNPDF